MAGPSGDSEKEGHRRFAVSFNGEVWSLLEKVERTPEDDERMLVSAFASLRHWLEVGRQVHRQRGLWLISRVYAALGNGQESLRWARACLEATQASPDEMETFDVGYAQEALARAYRTCGMADEAADHLAGAREIGATIKGDEDRRIFFADLEAP